MSITIDDMKMPKSCIACPFEHNGDCYGGKPKRIMDIEDFKSSRHPDCPLIEAEPRHGKWIYTEYETGHAELQCSECGEGVYNKTKFCPNCGAKMDGIEE